MLRQIDFMYLKLQVAELFELSNNRQFLYQKFKCTCIQDNAKSHTVISKLNKCA